MNGEYDSKRKPKLEADKVRNSPNQEKTNGPSTKNQNTICNSSNAEHYVSFLIGLLAQSKPRSFSVHYLKHIAL